MPWEILSAMVQVMAYHLLGTKLLYENADLLTSRPLGANLCKILIKIQTFSIKRLHLKNGCHFYPRPPSPSPSRVLSSFHASACIPKDVTTLTLWDFHLLASNLLGWCTVPWSRPLCKMAMIKHFLHVSWKFEIFHDRIRPGLRDNITALTL